MIKNKKIRWIFSIFTLLTLLALSLLSGCGISSPKSTEEAPMANVEYDKVVSEEAKADAGISVTTTADSANQTYTTSNLVNDPEKGKMMIYRGQLQMEVEDLKKGSALLFQTIKSAQGYLVTSNQSENINQLFGHYEFKIPVAAFHSTVNQLEEISYGKVTSQYIEGVDVTEEYLDIESRLKAKRVYEERLLDFLSKATKTEDLLKISNDLNRVQEEIEQMQGRQKYLSHHASYSTLIVDMVQNKNQVAPTAGTWEKAISGFQKSIEFLVDATKSLFIFMVSFFPILIFILILLFIAWKLSRIIPFKKSIKSIKKQDDENQQ